jgi:hypothetical protein
MGSRLLDQYSLLHAAVGVLAYFWNVPLWIGTILHILFEYAENTPWGIQLINKYMIEPGIFGWPGDKRNPDGMMNQIGDVLVFIVGWIAASTLDTFGRMQGWT